VVLLSLLTMLPGCRRQVVWFGAAVTDDGSLQVASEQPVCGCLTLTNQTDHVVLLRSEIGGSTSGGAAIHPSETRRFRFDWAGPRPGDVYIIDAMDEHGKDLVISDVLAMDAQPIDCEAPTCIFDTLLLNVAVEAEQ
jgi:hypothetical protein